VSESPFQLYSVGTTLWENVYLYKPGSIGTFGERKIMTVEELIKMLHKTDKNKPVKAEGCDCVNPAFYIAEYEDSVLIGTQPRYIKSAKREAFQVLESD
jgi:hypothetical protein